MQRGGYVSESKHISWIKDKLGIDIEDVRRRAGKVEKAIAEIGVQGEVREALGQASVLWSVYRSFRDLVEGDDLRANPLFGVIEQPGVGRYLAPASPVNTAPVNTAPPGGREPARAPLLGEHTAEILRTDLGLSEDKIRELHERGAVVSASPQR